MFFRLRNAGKLAPTNLLTDGRVFLRFSPPPLKELWPASFLRVFTTQGLPHEVLVPALVWEPSLAFGRGQGRTFVFLFLFVIPFFPPLFPIKPVRHSRGLCFSFFVLFNFRSLFSRQSFLRSAHTPSSKSLKGSLTFSSSPNFPSYRPTETRAYRRWSPCKERRLLPPFSA